MPLPKLSEPEPVAFSVTTPVPLLVSVIGTFVSPCAEKVGPTVVAPICKLTPFSPEATPRIENALDAS